MVMLSSQVSFASQPRTVNASNCSFYGVRFLNIVLPPIFQTVDAVSNNGAIKTARRIHFGCNTRLLQIDKLTPEHLTDRPSCLKLEWHVVRGWGGMGGCDATYRLVSQIPE